MTDRQGDILERLKSWLADLVDNAPHRKAVGMPDIEIDLVKRANRGDRAPARRANKQGREFLNHSTNPNGMCLCARSSLLWSASGCQ
jgi:hypothetical protein